LRATAGGEIPDVDALRNHPGYGSVIVRTRYTEDALASAVARGASQYVILGAGFDSFALRRPAFARDVDVFEVDHPGTQGFKRARLAACGIAVPDRLRFVAADLAQEDLGTVLAAGGFDGSRPAFFSWLGVTAYLTRAANLATLRAIARAAARGSELVFTYIDAIEFTPGEGTGELAGVRGAVAAIGEPMVCGFDPAAIGGDLRECGLTLVEDLDGDALRERCCAGRADGLRPTRTMHVARAAVGI
jgi:methyltransferase (TIGR00027 family)